MLQVAKGNLGILVPTSPSQTRMQLSSCRWAELGLAWFNSRTSPRIMSYQSLSYILSSWSCKPR